MIDIAQDHLLWSSKKNSEGEIQFCQLLPFVVFFYAGKINTMIEMMQLNTIMIPWTRGGKEGRCFARVWNYVGKFPNE